MNKVHRRIGLRDSVSFSCPFCKGGTATVGVDEDDCGVVLHTMPYCPKFGELQPEVFLREARLAMKNSDRSLS